jgi:hypothetical protein
MTGVDMPPVAARGRDIWLSGVSLPPVAVHKLMEEGISCNRRRQNQGAHAAVAGCSVSQIRTVHATGPVRTVDGINMCRQDHDVKREAQKGGFMANKKPSAEMTVEDALVALAGWHHSFVSEEGANRAARALGIEKPVPCYPGQTDRRGDPKGLSMHPGQEGSRGIAGCHLAQWICDRLEVKYESKMGRGFQTQACVEALSNHFKARKEK